MATVRFRIVLFPGQDRIPLDLLMEAMNRVGEFLSQVGRDMGLENTVGDWVATSIGGGSLGYTNEYKAEVPEDTAALVERGVRAAWDPEVEDTEIQSRISRAARNVVADIKRHVAPQGEMQVGFYEEPTSNSPSVWVNSLGNLVDRSGEDAPDVEPAPPRAIRFYGELRGTIEALYPTKEPPYLKLKDDKTNRQIVCYYDPTRHGEVVDSLKRRKAKVIVEGYMTRDAASGAIEKMEATHFHLPPKFDFNLFRKFRDTAEGITGGISPDDMTDLYRGGANAS